MNTLTLLLLALVILLIVASLGRGRAQSEIRPALAPQCPLKSPFAGVVT